MTLALQWDAKEAKQIVSLMIATPPKRKRTITTTFGRHRESLHSGREFRDTVSQILPLPHPFALTPQELFFALNDP